MRHAAKLTRIAPISLSLALSVVCSADAASGREPAPMAKSGDDTGGDEGSIPFGIPLSCTFNSAGQCAASFPAPASVGLTIEMVSARCFSNQGSLSSRAYLTTAVNPNPAANYHLLIQTQQDGSQVVSQLARINADPGTTIAFTSLMVGLGRPAASCDISLSGKMIRRKLAED